MPNPSAPAAVSAASTGPRTAAGKAISSQNATSHGLSCPRTVLAHESLPEFNRLSAELQNELLPQSPHEEFLVSQMTAARWKLRRAGDIETAVFEQMMSGAGTNPPQTPEAQMANVMMQRGGDTLTHIQRYIAALERSYYRAYRELLLARKLQNEVLRKAAAAESKAQEAALIAYLNAPIPRVFHGPSQTHSPVPGAAPHAGSHSIPPATPDAFAPEDAQPIKDPPHEIHPRGTRLAQFGQS